MEWLKVTCHANGQTATRRLRVIPTASMEAGASVVVTDKYDHADDVALVYSTAAHMAAHKDDLTVGIFPDCDNVDGANELTAAQKKLMDKDANAINTQFAGTNDTFRNVDISSYMTAPGQGDRLYVYACPVESIDAVTGQIRTGQTPIDFTAQDPRAGGQVTYAEQFNSNTPFTNVDEQYLLTYVWVLSDGRAIQDAKLIRRAAVPFDVTLDVYKKKQRPGGAVHRRHSDLCGS